MKILTIEVIILLIAANHSNAQVGIGTSTPKAGLHVVDSSVVFSAAGASSLPSAAPPVSGAGRRLMWFVNKGAFRVGYAWNDEWDKTNIGDYSVAMGFAPMAKGNASIALGTAAKSTGSQTVAIGSGTLASGNSSHAFGHNSVAEGDYSMAFGRNAKAIGLSSYAFGYNTVAGGQEGTTALGGFTRALGLWGATAMGYHTTAQGNGSTSAGEWSEASGHRSVAMGHYVLARSEGEAALGILNTDYTPKLDYFDRIFVVGFGDRNGEFPNVDRRRDALTILKNGNVGIGYGVGNAITNTFRLSVNGQAAKPGGGSWTGTSDFRAKKSITPYTRGLTEILGINPVSFQYNSLSGHSDTTSRYIGVIAHEIEKILPSTVSTITDDPLIQEKKVYDSSELIYTLINAIKELHQTNDALTSRVDSLEKLLTKMTSSDKNRGLLTVQVSK